MKRVTKKEINQYLSSIQSVERGFNTRLYIAGCYIKDDETKLYAGFVGQGIDENIYNESYDLNVEFDVLFSAEAYTKKELIDNIYETINEMIKEYKEGN